MLPKFIEDCNRLLLDGAADSARCLGLCAHSTTMPAREQRTVCKKQWPPNAPNLNSLQISCLGSDARSFFESFIRSQIQFLYLKSHWRKHGKIFCRKSCLEF